MSKIDPVTIQFLKLASHLEIVCGEKHYEQVAGGSDACCSVHKKNNILTRIKHHEVKQRTT